MIFAKTFTKSFAPVHSGSGLATTDYTPYLQLLATTLVTLVLLFAPIQQSQALEETVTGLPSRLTSDNLATIRRVSDFAAAIKPSRDSVPLTYDRLVINRGELVLQEYLDRTLAAGKFVLMMGGVLTGSVLLHDATTMMFAMDAAIVGGTAAAATGLIIYTFEDMVLDAGKEAVMKDLNKNMDYASFETNLMQEIEETINHRKPVQENYNFIIDLGKELDETIKKDYTRSHILLVKFALSYTLVDLAQTLATERSVIEAAPQLKELLLLAEELQLDIINSQPNSSIASAMMARISALRYVFAQNGVEAFEPADEHLFWAIQSLQTALVNEPANHYARLALVKLLSEQEEDDEALRLLEEYVEAGWNYDGSRAEILSYLADAYSMRNQIDAAVDAAKQALELDPNSRILRQLANLYHRVREDLKQQQVSAEEELAVLFKLLEKNQELNEEMCDEDPYYSCGKLISLHALFYDRALGLASDILESTGDHYPMLDAHSIYQEFLEQSGIDKNTPLGPGAAKFIKTAQTFNESGYLQRFNEMPTTLGQLWAPFAPSFWLGIPHQNLASTLTP